MRDCECSAVHQAKRVVLTGGPGAGKTAVLELVRQYFCRHVIVLPEAAGILFAGGFPRGPTAGERAAVQRAIFHVQRELEACATARDGSAIVLCDRGTVDGAAYWPGPQTLWSSLGVAREAELQRYDAVIHLRTPDGAAYNHSNPLRLETAAEAALIDQRIVDAWAGHPQRSFVANTQDFLHKAHATLALIREQLPECCRVNLPTPQLAAT
jgi:predicted ATPase